MEIGHGYSRGIYDTVVRYGSHLFFLLCRPMEQNSRRGSDYTPRRFLNARGGASRSLATRMATSANGREEREADTYRENPVAPRASIRRPLLEGRASYQVLKFLKEWEAYTMRVRSSTLPDAKKEEALNVSLSITDETLEAVVRYELLKFGIHLPPTHPGGPVIAYTKQELTTPILMQWLTAKGTAPLSIDEIVSGKKALEEELFRRNYYSHSFLYNSAKGPIKEQLEDHAMALDNVVENFGLKNALTDRQKVAYWIRLVRPKALSVKALLWMTSPGYEIRWTFVPATGPMRRATVSELMDDYFQFVTEFTHIVSTCLLTCLGVNPSAMAGFIPKALTLDERGQLGTELTLLLENRVEYPFVRGKYPAVPTKGVKAVKRGRSLSGFKQPHLKLRRLEVVDEDVGDDEDLVDEDENDFDNSGYSDEGDVEHEACTDEELDAMDDLNEEEIETVMMRASRIQQRAANIIEGRPCSNCGKKGCFSMRCKEPCKWCKACSNSWTCFERPVGYGSKKEEHPRRNDLGKARSTSSNYQPVGTGVPSRGSSSIFKRNSVRIRKIYISAAPTLEATLCGILRVLEVLIDTGAQLCSITRKLLAKLAASIRGGLQITVLEESVQLEFADGSTRPCTEKVFIPIMDIHLPSGRTLTVKNLHMLIMESDLEEVILGNHLLKETFGLDILDIMDHVNTNLVYDANPQVYTARSVRAWSYDGITGTATPSSSLYTPVSSDSGAAEYNDMLHRQEQNSSPDI